MTVVSSNNSFAPITGEQMYDLLVSLVTKPEGYIRKEPAYVFEFPSGTVIRTKRSGADGQLELETSPHTLQEGEVVRVDPGRTDLIEALRACFGEDQKRPEAIEAEGVFFSAKAALAGYQKDKHDPHKYIPLRVVQFNSSYDGEDCSFQGASGETFYLRKGGLVACDPESLEKIARVLGEIGPNGDKSVLAAPDFLQNRGISLELNTPEFLAHAYMHENSRESWFAWAKQLVLPLLFTASTQRMSAWKEAACARTDAWVAHSVSSSSQPQP